jgi:N-acetylneuraminic acid mutarotase
MSLDNDTDDNETTAFLKIGGKKFETTWTTLKRIPETFFSAFYKDDQKYIEVDRSNTYFEYILKFMEDGSFPTSPSVPLLLWLKREFNFYAFDLPPSPMCESIILWDDGRLVRVDIDTGRMNWMSSTPAPTFGRESIVRFLNKKYYVCVGIVDGMRPSDNVHRYDPSDDTWETLPRMIKPISTPMSVVVGDCLYLCEGHGATMMFTRYNSLRNTWEPRMSVAANNKPVSGLCTLGTDIYLLGGININADTMKLSDSVKYDTLIDQWSLVGGDPAPPSLDIHFSSIVIDEMIYLLNNYHTGTGEFYRFDPRRRTYSKLASASRDHFHGTLTSHNGNIYVVGDTFTECYDLDTDQWRILSSIVPVYDVCPVQILIDKSIPGESRLDQLLAVEMGRVEKLQLQELSDEEPLQCQMICKSGKRCRNPSVVDGQCHLKGKHGTQCGAGSEATTTLRLDGEDFVVATQTLYYLPKRILRAFLQNEYGTVDVKTDLSMLRCLQNMLMNHQTRHLPSFLFLDTNRDSVTSQDMNSGQKTTWEAKSTYLPRAVTLHSFQGDIYATGGLISYSEEEEEIHTSRKVFRCSSIHKEWEIQSSMSTPRIRHCTAVAGLKMYVIGGDVTNTAVEAFDGISWTTVAPLPIPMGTYEGRFAACVVDMKIYVFCGSTSTICCYDVETDKWTTIEPVGGEEPIQGGFGDITASFIKDRIYITFFKSMWTFVPSTSTLRKIVDNDFRLWYRWIVLNEQLYGMDPQGFISAFHTDTMTWTRMDHMGIPPTGLYTNENVFRTWAPYHTYDEKRLKSMIFEKTKEEAWEFLQSSPENDHLQNKS